MDSHAVADLLGALYVLCLVLSCIAIGWLLLRTPKVTSKEYSFGKTVWGWLIVIAFLYMALASMGGIATRIAGILGLFTPIGPWTIKIPWIPVIALVGVLFGEWLSHKRDFSPKKKILFILSWLLLLTFLADLTFVPGGSLSTFFSLTLHGTPLSTHF